MKIGLLSTVAFVVLLSELYACPLYILPICGSDGKTYGNECFMRMDALQQKKAIMTVHNGKCKEGQNDVNRCSFPCTMDYSPVCGSDRKQYPNECALRAASCMKKEAITIVQKGINAKCSECNIPCTREYNPVCGTDGHTYSTECVMRATSCSTKKPILKAYQGKCT